MSDKQRLVYYVCHPVRPTEDEIAATSAKYSRAINRDRVPEERATYTANLATDENVQRLGRWLAWLRKTWPQITFIAPWAADLLLGADDADPEQRERGLIDCETVVPLCAGVVLVGGRIGSGGMRERAVARNVVDMLHLGAEPPTTGYVDADWRWVS